MEHVVNKHKLKKKYIHTHTYTHTNIHTHLLSHIQALNKIFVIDIRIKLIKH